MGSRLGISESARPAEWGLWACWPYKSSVVNKRSVDMIGRGDPADGVVDDSLLFLMVRGLTGDTGLRPSEGSTSLIVDCV